MRTILVTGTAGFIGFHLSRLLLAEGFRVVGVDATQRRQVGRHQGFIEVDDPRHARVGMARCARIGMPRLRHAPRAGWR